MRSVERIRASVAEIDARALASRLEVPPPRDEIAALATTMSSMLDRLQASDRAQRAFVSDASHELRSPLSTLSTAAELAVRTDDEATRRRLLQTMNAELARMRDVGRRQRIAQPLRNLVDNAERHAQTTIRLTLTTDGDQALIWVDDDGSVIDLADRDRVFERFVRLDDSRSRDAGGCGLGLAITLAGIRSQGGDVAVVDTPDNWCRFELRLPPTTGAGSGELVAVSP